MQERICGEHIDNCRAAVRYAVQMMRHPRYSDELLSGLHQVISTILNRDINRAWYHSPTSGLLPDALHAQLGSFKSRLRLADFAPLVEMRSSQWKNAMIELFSRLERDWAHLVRCFSMDPGAAVSGISESLGDYHNDGRSVYRISFTDGCALIYKPRSVETELAFGSVVEWTQAQGCEPRLKWCRVLSRHQYGWTEYVQPSFCENEDGAARFYERHGAFLALFYFLHASDCIAENVICAGEDPIWVDVECICPPTFSPPPDVFGGPGATFSWLKHSVLSTSLVYNVHDVRNDPRKSSALQESCLPDRSVIFSDRGIMHDRFVKAVQRGFGKFYEWMLEHRSAWGASGPIESAWARKYVRVIPRPTALYASLADWMSILPFEARAEAMPALADVLRANSQKQGRTIPLLKRLIEIEVQTLSRGDVPLWRIRTDSRTLYEASGSALAGAAWQPGIERLSKVASLMTTQDLRTQTWLIDGFLRLHKAA